MNLNKYLLVNNNDVLEEGITFFKTSKRLFKLNEKLIKSIEMTENARQRRILITTANKIQRLGNKFKFIEDQYNNKDLKGKLKPQLKLEYKKLLNDYKEILILMKKEETKSALKAVSMFGFMILTMAIPLKFMAPVAEGIGVDLNDTSWTGLFKRSGIYMALGIPARILSGLTQSAIDKIIDSRGKGENFEEKATLALKSKNI